MPCSKKKRENLFWSNCIMSSCTEQFIETLTSNILETNFLGITLKFIKKFQINQKTSK